MGELIVITDEHHPSDAIEEVIAGLTPMQSRFVHAYCANGGKGTKAALAAGYGGAGAAAMSSRMLRNPLIIKAILAVSQEHLSTAVPAAIRTVAKLSTNAKSEYVKLMAASDVLNRVGMVAPKQVHVAAGVKVSIDLS